MVVLNDGLKEDYKGLVGRNADSVIKLQIILFARQQRMVSR